MNLAELNDKQLDAVKTTKGPLLIIAGAGSGKTRALTHRMAHMVMGEGVDPSHILAVTFTNKAANEMKERLRQLLEGVTSKLPHMGTFHSICVRILRRDIHHLGYENSFVIYDAADSLALIKRICKERNIDPKKVYPKAIQGAISKAKNELVGPEGYLAFARSNSFHDVVNQVYKLYQAELHKSSALDFDDIIMKTVELLEQHPNILEKYQNIFQFISVDEYQDTNNAQYKLISMLAEKYRNICVIGDDWQSIYSWRGANMRNILHFETDYPDAKVIKLEQNYRSPKAIVEAANAVIAKNSQRSDKELWTEKDNGERILLQETNNERDEGERIADSIETLVKEKGVSYNDIAILYRTNAQSRILEDCMLMRGLPYRIVGGVRFYERKEIKDMLAYLKCIHNPMDNTSFLRIINVPSRKIGARTVEIINEYAVKAGCSLLQAVMCYDDIEGLKGAAQKAVAHLADLFNEFFKCKDEYAVAGILKHVIGLTKFQKFLEDGTDEGAERFANVAELVNVASKYDVLEPGVALATFLEEVALVSDIDVLNEENTGITLMTLHSSKGLEYPYVFIAGLEEGLFPSTRSQMNPDDLEEERRIMYVGMTRAMEKLFLSFTKTRMLYGEYQYNSPSRFLQEIPHEYVESSGHQLMYRGGVVENPNLLETAPMDNEPRVVPIDEEEQELFQPGEKIRHRSWGVGTVIEQYKDKLTVVFENPLVGRKMLLLDIAPIERIIEY